MTEDSELREPQPAGGFERYALVGSLTLLILVLLLADRFGDRPAAEPVPPGELLRVEMGGREARATTPPRTDVTDRRELERAPGREPQAPPTAVPPRFRDDHMPPQTPEPRIYVVQSGDTLSSIASRELGTTRRAGEIARLNGLPDPDRIRAGDTLRLPSE